jgi:hypothetical protein
MRAAAGQLDAAEWLVTADSIPGYEKVVTRCIEEVRYVFTSLLVIGLRRALEPHMAIPVAHACHNCAKVPSEAPHMNST